jgi:hypothetical protein
MGSLKICLISFIIVLFGSFSCEENSSVINESYYGRWKLYDVSGGFTGRGHTLNFDYLEIEKVNKYRFLKNDTIIEYGIITLVEDSKERPLFNFNPDKNSDKFMGDSEKYFVLEGNDTLNLNSPCCDRYNYHFVRE